VQALLREGTLLLPIFSQGDTRWRGALALFLMVNGVCKYLFAKDHQLHVQWPQRASVAAWIRDERAESPQLIGEILLARAAHSEGDEGSSPAIQVSWEGHSVLLSMDTARRWATDLEQDRSGDYAPIAPTT
jgi:hypothetical protein